MGKVDEQQVLLMARTYTNKTVAKRLGISTRTVTRILKKHNAQKKIRCSEPDKDQERAMIHFERKHLKQSLGKVARYHGLSRQAVHQQTNKLLPGEGEAS